MSSFTAAASAKKAGLPIALACVALAACTNLDSKPSAVNSVPAPVANLHVLELFTSEGCSSCPAADKLLSKLKAEADSTVFLLSYHVDYWNYLGWKDPFSQAVFSNRQRQYAQRFGLDGSYTPQLIVNGEEEFVGSDEKRLRTSLAKGSSASVRVTASAAWTDKNTLRVSYSLSSPEGLTLNVALVQNEAKTDVKRGENGGRILQHVNVVRDLKTAEAQPTGNVDIRLPGEGADVPFSVIVFVQQKGGGKIVGAKSITVPLQKGA